VCKGRLGCVVFGVFPKRPAFASSVFFILAVLFVPTGGGGGDADRCRVDFSAFLVPFDVYFLPDFFVRRRRLVVVADFRRMLLLVEVLVDLVVATVVFVVDVVLVAEVDLVVERPVAVVAPVVLEVAVDAVAVEAAIVVIFGLCGCPAFCLGK
jgi:hypothetical protein